MQQRECHEATAKLSKTGCRRDDDATDGKLAGVGLAQHPHHRNPRPANPSLLQTCSTALKGIAGARAFNRALEPPT
jgi:hypothetical protein